MTPVPGNCCSSCNIIRPGMSEAVLLDAANRGDKEQFITLLGQCKESGLEGATSNILHLTCRNGWLDVSVELIEKWRMSPEETDEVHGASPLHFACTSGNIELVKYLIFECSCNPYQLSEDGLTVLHCAVMGGIAIVKYLVEDLVLKQLFGFDESKLMLFSYNNWDNDMIKYLIIEQKCGITVNGTNGDTLLHSVCRDGDIQKLKFLLEECKCLPPCVDNREDTIQHTYTSRLSSSESVPSYNPGQFMVPNFAGLTPIDSIITSRKADGGVAMLQYLLSFFTLDFSCIISIAYHYWNDSMIKYLIVEKQCSVVTSHETGNTLLHNACRDMNMNKLKFLVEECHCDPTVVNNQYDTLVHAFCSSVFQPIDFEILSYLCEKHHCNPILRNSLNLTPLEYAIIYGKKQGVEIVHYFLENWDCKTYGVQILSLAYEYWNYSMIKYLLVERVYDVVINSENGDSILHKACKGNFLIRLKFLINKCSCNPLVVNNDGDTLLHTVCKSPTVDLEFVSFLCEIIPYTINNNAGHSSLNYAIMHKRSDIVMCLIKQSGDHSISNEQSSEILRLAYEFWNDDIIKFLILEANLGIVTNSDTSGTLLHKACQEGNLNRLKFLVEECQCSPHFKNRYGASLLHESLTATFEVLHYLCIECNCCTSLSDYENYITAVQNAIAHKENGLPVVQHLVNKCGCNIKNNSHIIFQAYLYWHDEMIKYLITEIGCSLIVDDVTDNTILHKVCSTGNLLQLKFLVEDCHCSPHIENNQGVSLLHVTYQGFLSHPAKSFEILHYLCLQCNCLSLLTSDDIKVCEYCIDQGDEESLNVLHYLIENCECESVLSENGFVSIMSLAYSNWHQHLLKYLIIERGWDLAADVNSGDTVLHKSVSENPAQLKFLLEECKCDPYVVNDNGETFLHAICKSASISNQHCEIIFYLYEERKNSDLHNLKDKHGNTALHLLCNSIKFEGNNSISVGVLYYFLTNYKCDDTNCKNKDGFTILHLLCLKSNNKTDVLKLIFYLINEGMCNPLIKDVDLNTILHILVYISKRYSSDLISLFYWLIHEYECDVTLKNVDGNTPLHLACLKFNGDISIIELILSTGKADPLCLNKNNETPLMLLDRSILREEDKASVRQLISRFGEVKLAHPINSVVNIVLLGHPGAGKSTLSKVIEDRNKYSSLTAQFKHVKGVELLTAGIVPHLLNDRHLGSIILHDLAGHVEYYSSHTAVLENLLQGSAAVFIIVVSLADENFLKSLYLWLSIVENVSHNAFFQCQLMVVASHIDQQVVNKVSKTDRLSQVLLERLSNDEDSNLINRGVFSLDCRKLGGNHLSSLISTLSIACHSISKNYTREMSLYCHMLYDFFKRDKKSVYKLEDLVQATKDSNGLFLPRQIDQLNNIVSALSTTGLIVLLRNVTEIGKSWIVIDKSILLSDLDGVLFAPKDFKQHANIASNTGVVKLSDLFSLFPKHDSELLLKFLQYMELCQVITEDFITCTNVKPISDTEGNEKYIFVPALINNAEKPEIEEVFKFGWCLCCLNSHDFFVSRFFHLLLLHLAYKFTESGLNKFERLCEVWSKGIYWKDTKGVQTLVELVDGNQSLILLTSCQDGATNDMVRLMKGVITEILTCKEQVMPKTKTHEFIFDSSYTDYPIELLSAIPLFSIELLAKCYINGNKYILDKTGTKQIPVSDLFPEATVKLFCDSIFADRNPQVLKILGSKQKNYYFLFLFYRI